MDVVRVRISSELYFEPADVTVSPGTRVVWSVDADMMKCLEHHVVVRRLDFLVSSDATQCRRHRTKGESRIHAAGSAQRLASGWVEGDKTGQTSDEEALTSDSASSGSTSPSFTHDLAVFESPAMYTGDEWSHVFTKPGVFTIENSTYEMIGRVFVEDVSDEPLASKPPVAMIQSSNRVRSESWGSGLSTSLRVRPHRGKQRQGGVSTDRDGSSVESASVSNVSVATSSTGRGAWEASTRASRVAVSSVVSPPPAVHVTIRGFQFIPTHVRVSIGQSIVWTNSAESECSHGVESVCGRLCSPVLAPAQSYTLLVTDDTFAAGIIRYYNPVYSFMKGEIIVARGALLEDVRDSDRLLAAFVHRWSPTVPRPLTPPPPPPPTLPFRTAPKPAPDSPLRGLVNAIHSLVPVKKPTSPSRPSHESAFTTAASGAEGRPESQEPAQPAKKKKKKKRGRKKAGSVVSITSGVSDVMSEASSAYTSSECGGIEGPAASALSTLGLSGRALRDMPVPNVHGLVDATPESDSDEDALVIHRKQENVEVLAVETAPWVQFFFSSESVPASQPAFPVACFNPLEASAFFASRWCDDFENVDDPDAVVVLPHP